MGAKVLTLSDSSGYIYDKDGIDKEKLEYIMELKNVKRKEFPNMLKNILKQNFIPIKTLGL